jgi:hypothetical protein
MDPGSITKLKDTSDLNLAEQSYSKFHIDKQGNIRYLSLLKISGLMPLKF